MCDAIALHEAYKRGDLEALKAALGNPPDFPNSRGPRGVGENILGGRHQQRHPRTICHQSGTLFRKAQTEDTNTKEITSQSISRSTDQAGAGGSRIQGFSQGKRASEGKGKTKAKPK